MNIDANIVTGDKEERRPNHICKAFESKSSNFILH